MNEPEIRALYYRYISYLNGHRVQDLDDFVNETLSYNGKQMTRAGYQDMIAANFDIIPDLYFDVNLLLVNVDCIGCRINFECTPQKKFLGLQPNGKKISFSEHVFYKLRGNKIDEIWSVLDESAIEAQMTA